MNRSFKPCWILIHAFLLFPPTTLASDTESERNRLRVSWKSMRDEGVVRQQFDFSCGAASIATLLTSHFLDPVDEMTVLKLLPSVHRPYSLADMVNALNALGYESAAVRLDLATLQQLTAPAILFMQPRRAKTTVGHLVVLRRLGYASVSIADPSLGNRTYSLNDFRRRWSIPGNTSETAQGIALIVRKTVDSIDREDPNHRKHDYFRRAESPILLRGPTRRYSPHVLNKRP